MTGEIHLTHEVVDRLIRGELSQDERQALLEHLDGSGSCRQCDKAADDPDDDERFERLLDHYARLKIQALRRRAEDGDPEAERELHDLRFDALMRQLREQKEARNGRRGGVPTSFHGRLVNVGQQRPSSRGDGHEE